MTFELEATTKTLETQQTKADEAESIEIFPLIGEERNVLQLRQAQGPFLAA